MKNKRKEYICAYSIYNTFVCFYSDYPTFSEWQPIPEDLGKLIDNHFSFQELKFTSKQNPIIFDFLKLAINPKTRKIAELLYL